MREIYRFYGRGQSSVVQGRCCMIETAEGAVLEITEAHGKTDFVVAYCRKAIADRWGVCCFEPFRRVSDIGLTRSWAERYTAGMFIFRGVRLHLTQEEDWMRQTE